MVILMLTIKKIVSETLMIKNSIFTSYIYPINDEKEAKNIIDQFKHKTKNIDHICYGYITKGVIRKDDNHEPTNTAGLPIINILIKNNLTNILAIVTRHYGGIKLGCGPLTRAYSKVVSLALKQATMTPVINSTTIELTFTKENTKIIDHILETSTITHKYYDDLVHYTVIIIDDEIITLLNEIEGCTIDAL